MVGIDALLAQFERQPNDVTGADGDLLRDDRNGSCFTTVELGNDLTETGDAAAGQALQPPGGKKPKWAGHQTEGDDRGDELLVVRGQTPERRAGREQQK